MLHRSQKNTITLKVKVQNKPAHILIHIIVVRYSSTKNRQSQAELGENFLTDGIKIRSPTNQHNLNNFCYMHCKNRKSEENTKDKRKGK